MDLHRTSILNQMDYSGEGRDAKEGKVQSTEERLDSGLDSLKEEEYVVVTEELQQLRLECPPQQQRQECSNEPWKTQVSEDGDTLLHLAIIHEAKDCATRLIELSRNEAFLNLHNYQRQTPLHLAVITDQAELVERLLRAGSDPTPVDDRGNTALHIACSRGSLACFSVLTQACPSHLLPDIMATPNYSGQHCLHLASTQGFLSLVESLFALGADINAQEQCNGRSPLHLAVDLQNLPLVRLLLSLGANANSLTYGGHTPYHLTYGRQNAAIQKVLHSLTDQNLRELPDSEPDDDEDDYDEDDKDEGQSSDEEQVEYDDITWNGQK